MNVLLFLILIEYEVVIFGVGMLGLCMVIQLQCVGIDDFFIVEQFIGIGGIWWDNCYLGVQVDVLVLVYSFSFVFNLYWIYCFVDVFEIQCYQQCLVEEYGLFECVCLGWVIIEVCFDVGVGCWQLWLDDGQLLSVCFFVCSIGVLYVVCWFDFLGLIDFQGWLLYSVCWLLDVDLVGQCVGVVGIGLMVVQFVLVIVLVVVWLIVFQCIGNWVLLCVDC